MTSLSLALSAALLGATTTEIGTWTVLCDRRSDELLRLLAEALPRTQREIEQKLGLEMTRRGTVVLCGSLEGFRQAAPGFDPRHTLGVAYPDRCVLYLNCQAIEATPWENLAITLRHEMSHLVAGEVARRGYRRVPLWFDEGIAVRTSGKLPSSDPDEFRRAVAAGALPPLAELADSFPFQPIERGVAYQASESFIRDLVERFGERVVPEILKRAGSGVDFAGAVRGATGSDLATLEAQWLESLRGQWPWVTWVVHSVSLFAGMSLLAIVAFVVYRRRRRQKYAEWEREERAAAGGDGP